VKTLYIALDNVLANFDSSISALSDSPSSTHETYLDEAHDLYSRISPLPYSIESFQELSSLFDTYILATTPWDKPSNWPCQLSWLKRHFGKEAYNKLIVTHHKHLKLNEFLVDDKNRRGEDGFLGEQIHFKTDKFPDWPTVLTYLRTKAD
jgi:5'(3')-deoxyribonucleotidase